MLPLPTMKIFFSLHFFWCVCVLVSLEKVRQIKQLLTFCGLAVLRFNKEMTATWSLSVLEVTQIRFCFSTVHLCVFIETTCISSVSSIHRPCLCNITVCNSICSNDVHAGFYCARFTGLGKLVALVARTKSSCLNCWLFICTCLAVVKVGITIGEQI